MPTMRALCSRAAAMNFSAEVSVPRSTMVKPAPSAIMPTRFLPMSCRSPFTVPMTMVAESAACSSRFSVRSGFRTAIPAFMARAASSTSGTKMRLCLKSSPTTRMPPMSPSSRTSMAGRPSARASSVIFFTGSCFPSKRSWFMRA